MFEWGFQCIYFFLYALQLVHPWLYKVLYTTNWQGTLAVSGCQLVMINIALQIPTFSIIVVRTCNKYHQKAYSINTKNNDINKIMIAHKLADLLIWKMRQGIAVYHHGE